MGKYRAYAEYKDSGVEWLGAVPSHWRLEKAKFLFDRKQRPVREADGVVTAFRDGEVTLRSNRREAGFTNSLKEIGYQGVRVGDLLIHAMDGFAGAIGVSDSDGKCSPVCSVCVPAGRYGVITSYYGRLLRDMALTGFVSALAKGIRERSTEFRFNEFKELTLTLPPEDEQTQIAAFLDRETAKIDRLIAKQEALIELLKEKRQAVISHAVTKGLDPDAPMKDSGVEWLGEIPAHWGVAPFYAFFEVQLGKMLDSKKITGKHLAPYLRNTDVQWDRINADDLPMMDFSDEDRIKFELRCGDLIVCEGGEIGRCAIWDGELHDCYYQKALHRIRPLRDNSIWIRFAFYFMRFMAKNEIFSASANQPTIAHLTAEQIRCVRIPALPFEEQKQIAEYLDRETQKIDETVGVCLGAILLLQERRTALISAAVTGKIDVREEIL